MHGGYHFFDSTGNDVQVWGSSTSLYGIVAGATPTQLISSATLNSTWDCADTQGSAYCVNSNRNAFVKTNGATMSWYATPLGTMVEATPDRIVVAGVAGTLNTLYISQSNTFTNFTTGVNNTDAFTEVIASPGSKLYHIRWGCGKLLWWKDQSFGYFDFDNQYVAQVKTVSDSIGTFDNTSAIDPGGRVWFRGQDGHVWMYDCSFLTKQSIDITPNIQASGNRVLNSWQQTTDSDFGNGDLNTVSTAPAIGNVYLDYSSTTARQSTTWSTGTTGWTGASNFLFQNGDSIAYLGNTYHWLHRGNTSINGRWQTSYTIPSGPGLSNGSLFRMYFMANIPPVDASQADFSNGYCVQVYYPAGTTTGTISLIRKDDTVREGGTTLVSSTFTFSVNSDTDHPLWVSHFPNGLMVVNKDGVNVLSATDITYSTGTYFGFYARTDTNRSVYFVNAATIYIPADAITGVFRSAVKNAPNLTGWSTLTINSANNGGSQVFSMRSSTNIFTVNTTTIPWTSQTSGSLVTISTGTYFQFQDTMTVTLSTQAPNLSDFTVNWFEGAASDQSYMIYFDNAIWESVAFGGGQSTNNYIFKYDLINEGWTLYNFGAGGLLVQSNVLYFGDTSAGNVFNYGTVTADNGSAINAYFKSKDFVGPDPFLQNQLTQVDTFAKKNAGSTLTATYTVDTSTATSYSVSLTNATQNIVQSRKLLPSGKNGYVFNIQYGDNSTSSAWELFGYRIGFIQQAYRPSQ